MHQQTLHKTGATKLQGPAHSDQLAHLFFRTQRAKRQQQLLQAVRQQLRQQLMPGPLQVVCLTHTLLMVQGLWKRPQAQQTLQSMGDPMEWMMPKQPGTRRPASPSNPRWRPTGCQTLNQTQHSSSNRVVHVLLRHRLHHGL